MSEHTAEESISEKQARAGSVLSRLAARRSVWPLLIAILTFAVYAPTLAYQFVYDDQSQIVTQESVHSWRFLPSYFVGDVWSHINPEMKGLYFRPLFLVWLLLNYKVFGLHPLWWHLTTVCMHVGVTILVYFFAIKLGATRNVSAFAALVFGLHPAHIEGVAWISGVTEPMMAILVIGSLLLYIGSGETATSEADSPGGARLESGRISRWSRKFASLILFGMALMDKETAIVLPGLVFAYEYLFNAGSPQSAANRTVRRLGKAALRASPYLAVGCLYLLLRARAIGGFAPGEPAFRWSTVLLTIPSVLCFYVKTLFFPVGLSPYYYTPFVKSAGFATFWLMLLFLAVIASVVAGWSIRARGRIESRLVAYSGCWMLLTILPALNFGAFYVDDIAHDRYLYLPSVGFSFLAAIALDRIYRFFSQQSRVRVPDHMQRVGAVVAVTVLVAMAAGTIAQERFWKDDLTLFLHAVSKTPSNANVRMNLAGALFHSGQYERALQEYLALEAKEPNHPEINFMLGYIYGKLGMLPEARRYMSRAIELNPSRSDQYVYLGVTLLNLGELDRAAATLLQSLKIDPKTPNAHYALGLVYKRMGRPCAAIDQFNQELGLNPQHSAARQMIRELECSNPDGASDSALAKPQRQMKH